MSRDKLSLKGRKWYTTSGEKAAERLKCARREENKNQIEREIENSAALTDTCLDTTSVIHVELRNISCASAEAKHACTYVRVDHGRSSTGVYNVISMNVIYETTLDFCNMFVHAAANPSRLVSSTLFLRRNTAELFPVTRKRKYCPRVCVIAAIAFSYILILYSFSLSLYLSPLPSHLSSFSLAITR